MHAHSHTFSWFVDIHHTYDMTTQVLVVEFVENFARFRTCQEEVEDQMDQQQHV